MEIVRSEPIVRGAETWLFDSSAGPRYEISVSVAAPKDAVGPHAAVYVLDANAWFPLAAQIMGSMHRAGELPPLVTVGVGYPLGPLSDDAVYEEWLRRRTWDLFEAGTLARGARVSQFQTGGGDAFRSALLNEIVPWVERTYPIDPERRFLFGDSAGAHFVLRAILSEPESFSGWICGSPGRWWDSWNEQLSSWRASKPVGLFLGVGRDEPSLDGFREIATQLGGLAERGLRLISEEYEGETHITAVWRNLTQGLRAIVSAPTD